MLWCTLALTAAVGLLASPGAARAASTDAATTSAYLKADHALVATASSNLPSSQAALLGLLDHVRRSCPSVAADSPQDPESTQLSDELIGAMVLSGGHVDRQAVRAYTSTARHLRWGNQQLNRTVQFHVRSLETLLRLPTPDICADVRSWASSDFKALPARTVMFAHVFIEGWVRPGNLPAGLAAFEHGSDLGLARQASQLEWRITDFESEAVETWGSIMDALALWP